MAQSRGTPSCTEPDSVKIVNCHSWLLGRKLHINKGTQVITLSAPGFVLPGLFLPDGRPIAHGPYQLRGKSYAADLVPLPQYIYDIYKRGDSIFADNDTSVELTPAGQELAKKLYNMQEYHAWREDNTLLQLEQDILFVTRRRLTTVEGRARREKAGSIIWTWLANNPDIANLSRQALQKFPSVPTALKRNVAYWLQKEHGHLPLEMAETYLAASYGAFSPEVHKYRAAYTFLKAHENGRRIFYPKNHVGPADINAQGLRWSGPESEIEFNNVMGIKSLNRGRDENCIPMEGYEDYSDDSSDEEGLGLDVVIPPMTEGAPPLTLGALITVEGSGTYILAACRDIPQVLGQSGNTIFPRFSVLPLSTDPTAPPAPESIARSISASHPVPEDIPALYKGEPLPMEIPITQRGWQENLLVEERLEPAEPASMGEWIPVGDSRQPQQPPAQNVPGELFPLPLDEELREHRRKAAERDVNIFVETDPNIAALQAMKKSIKGPQLPVGRGGRYIKKTKKRRKRRKTRRRRRRRKKRKTKMKRKRKKKIKN